ncbi:aminotransferase class I/II-fold pyridoxal phosphate-dependent enzyme [Nitrospira sp. M1]
MNSFEVHGVQTSDSLKTPRQTASPKVYYAQPRYGEEEIAAVVKSLQNPLSLVHGPCTSRMEQEVAKLFGKSYGVMVNSASSANTLAVAILDLPPGSEVITPAVTFSTTVAPLVHHGLIPAFIDVELDTLNIDAEHIERMITPATRAMMIPNLIGNIPDWAMLRSIADRHDLMVIEDSADTVGSTFEGVPTGQLTDISTTSFYATHVITCAGSGGMICMNNPDLETRTRILSGWGRSSARFQESERIEDRFDIVIDDIPYDRKFVFEAIGHNFLPLELMAAFGLVQLSKLQEFGQRRQENFQQLRDFFLTYEEWFILPRQLKMVDTLWLAFPLIIRDDAPFSRRDLQIYFEEQGIQTRVVFTGNILRQPAFKSITHRADAAGYPNADYIMRGGLLIGCHQSMDEEHVEYIKDAFRHFVARVTVSS